MNTTANIAAARTVEEIFAFATPAQKARATRAANKALNGQKLADWSAEERDAGFYADVFTAEQLAAIIAASGYIDNASKA